MNKMFISLKDVIQNDLDDDTKLALQLQQEEQEKVVFKNQQKQQQLNEEKESLKLIQKMNVDYQLQFNEGFLKVDKVEAEEEFTEFTCEICLETLKDNEVIPLSSCEHLFHAECIKQFIQSQVDA